MRRLFRQEEGVTAVEFALLAPVFFLLLFGMIEFGLIYFYQSMLESAVSAASRTGTTGYTPGGMSREDYLIQQIEDLTAGAIDTSLITVDMRAYGSFEDVGQPEPYSDLNASGAYDPGEPYTDVNGNGMWDPLLGTAGAGGPGQVVAYTVNYPYPVLFGLLHPFLGSTINLKSVWVVRNEPAG